MTMVVQMGPQLVGSEPTVVGAVRRGPLGTRPLGPVEGIIVMICGMDMRQLVTIPP